MRFSKPKINLKENKARSSALAKGFLLPIIFGLVAFAFYFVYQTGAQAAVTQSKATVLKEWLLIVKGYCSNDNTVMCRKNLDCGAGNTCLANTKDAIGLKIAKNSGPYSPIEWYRKYAPNPEGSPQSATVDGYPAIRDSRSIYIVAINHVDSEKMNYINTYILSYSSDASDYTKQIFEQIIKRWKFNTNITQSGTCSITKESQCLLDSECPENEYCASIKAKLIRDMQRLNDSRTMLSLLSTYKVKHNGQYPQLTKGTYIPGFTISKWTSWQSELGSQLGTTLPVDPINDFGAACPEGSDPQTCWNSGLFQYTLPQGSHFYIYNSHDAQNKIIRVPMETADCQIGPEYGDWKVMAAADLFSKNVSKYCPGQTSINSYAGKIFSYLESILNRFVNSAQAQDDPCIEDPESLACLSGETGGGGGTSSGGVGYIINPGTYEVICGDGLIVYPENCDTGVQQDYKIACTSNGYAGQKNATCVNQNSFCTLVEATGATCGLTESCGDNAKNGLEQCDGAIGVPFLSSDSCTSAGLTGKKYYQSCDSTCHYSNSACVVCGNGTIDPTEGCDYAYQSQATEACTYNYQSGTRLKTCNHSTCQWDLGSCQTSTSRQCPYDSCPGGGTGDCCIANSQHPCCPSMCTAQTDSDCETTYSPNNPAQCADGLDCTIDSYGTNGCEHICRDGYNCVTNSSGKVTSCSAQTGGVNQACNTDGSCSSGLICVSNKCVSCVSSCPSSANVTCGQTDSSLKCDRSTCAVQGLMCSSGWTCINSSCVECVNTCPSPSAVGCGTTNTVKICAGGNCSVTGTMCSSGQTCSNNQCVSCVQSCQSASAVDCGTTYTAPLCAGGSCNVAGSKCDAGKSCQNNSCQQVSCPSGQISNTTCYCENQAVTSGYCCSNKYYSATPSDNNNCGACGTVCATNQTCQNGTCETCATTCPAASTLACGSTNTGDNGCGGTCNVTGTMCPNVGETCSNGTCHFDGYLYITTGSYSLAKYQKGDLTKVNELGSQGTGQNQFGAPAGIAGDAFYLYVVDASNNRILKQRKSDLTYVSECKTFGPTNSDTFANPYGIAVDSNYIYITEVGNSRIVKLNKSDFSVPADGIYKIGSNGTGNDNFKWPRGIASDSTYLYVGDINNNRVVKRLKSDLSFIAAVSTGSTGFGYYQIATDNTYLFGTSNSSTGIIIKKNIDLSYAAKGNPNSNGLLLYPYNANSSIQLTGLCVAADDSYMYGSAPNYSGSLVKMNKSDFSLAGIANGIYTCNGAYVDSSATSDCTGYQCGTDSYGNSCGTCATGKTCKDYMCVDSCTSSQAGTARCSGSTIQLCSYDNGLYIWKNTTTCTPATGVCVDGQNSCQVQQCSAGQISTICKCAGTSQTSGYCCSNAYYSDLLTNSSNCGSCGNACPSGSSCVNGVCNVVRSINVYEPTSTASSNTAYLTGKMTVKYSYTGLSTDNIDLYYYYYKPTSCASGGTKSADTYIGRVNICSSGDCSMNLGQADWSIPDNLTLTCQDNYSSSTYHSLEYHVKVVNVNDTTAQDSDDAFTLQEPSVSVVSPGNTSAGYWQRGTTKTISWTNTGLAGNCRIDLLQGTRIVGSTQDTSGMSVYSTLTTVPCSNLSYNWTIPSSLAVTEFTSNGYCYYYCYDTYSPVYAIRITSIDYPGATDDSSPYLYIASTSGVSAAN